MISTVFLFGRRSRPECSLAALRNPGFNVDGSLYGKLKSSESPDQSGLLLHKQAGSMAMSG